MKTIPATGKRIYFFDRYWHQNRPGKSRVSVTLSGLLPFFPKFFDMRIYLSNGFKTPFGIGYHISETFFMGYFSCFHFRLIKVLPFLDRYDYGFFFAFLIIYILVIHG